MKKLYAIGLIAVAAILVSFTQRDSKYFEISKNIEIFTNVYKELNTWYVDDLDPATVMSVGINAMVGSLDPFTNYFSESQIEGYRYQSEGKFDGVGADIKIVDGVPTLMRPSENSPALEAGLRAGDQIIAVNGESSEGRSREDVLKIMRGVPGTQVELTIKSPDSNEMRDVTLTRGEVRVPNVPYSGMVDDGIGYIALTTFTMDAGRNVANALRNLKTDDPDLKGVIFDLRGNGGGLLREAVNVSNVFVDKGEEVVSTRGKVPERDRVYGTKNAPVDTEIPLVVLVDNTSASASEIVSGVVQDLDRGVLVGQRTYGKGLVQNSRDVGYNAKLKLTTAKYYIPSGRCIQSVEYANGEPVNIPDDQRARFETRNGRTVLDGGGVKPDVLIEPRPKPDILKALEENNLIFKYVTEYCLEHPTIAPVESFEFTGYDDFVRYVEKQGLVYTTDAEKTMTELVKQVEDLGLGQPLKGEIKDIRETIENDKTEHIDKYREEIIAAIEMDIIGRYYYETGLTQQRLKKDPELKQAIDLLNDRKSYLSILQ